VPASDSLLRPGDRLLFCGRSSAAKRMEWTLQNEHALNYVLTGRARPQGLVWRLFDKDTKRQEDV
jgi:voltage-gated potassium channel